MVNLYKVNSVWTGVTGLPGVSTFYTLSVPTISRYKTFFDAIAAAFPPGIKVTTQATGNIIESTTGTLTGQWSGGTDVVSQMTGGTASYTSASGPYVRWITSTVLDGRIVKGRTFLTPVSISAYDAAGNINTNTVSVIQAAATALVSAHAQDLVLWHRPRAARAATATKPAVAARPGGHAIVTGAVVPTKVGVLRSRRD